MTSEDERDIKPTGKRKMERKRLEEAKEQEIKRRRSYIRKRAESFWRDSSSEDDSDDQNSVPH